MLGEGPKTPRIMGFIQELSATTFAKALQAQNLTLDWAQLSVFGFSMSMIA